MGWFSNIFRKKAESEKPNAITSDLNFVEGKDAVTLKSEVTNWIRTQNSPQGTLIWFVLPYEKNQCSQPCFGVLADPILYGKLDRTESFNIAFVPTDPSSSFQWHFGFEDPDNPGTTIKLVTDLLVVDKSSLEKLRYVAEHMRTHYLFYVSTEFSNFLYMEMFPEFNEKLYQFYVSLRRALTERESAIEKKQPRNELSHLLVGPKTPRPTISRRDGQLGIPHISETSIELADGTIIRLSDIKEISDCGVVLGAPNHPLVRAINAEIEQGHSVVYLLFVSENRPSSVVIPVVDRPTAIAIAEQIKIAKDSLKKQKSTRVIVGECAECHRKLRIKEHAIKPKMVLTCKCGKQNVVHVLGKSSAI